MSLERFLYDEARLMDELRFDEWLALWEPGGSYWVPLDPDDVESKLRVSIINDDYDLLCTRIDRLKSGTVLALEDLRGAMRRIVGNIVIEEESGDDIVVSSNFQLTISRRAEQQIWAGRSLHRLVRRGDGGYGIAHKKVLLTNSRREIPLLQFLV